MLSVLLYRNRPVDPAFIERNAKLGETVIYLHLLMPIYWLFLSGWYLAAGYVGLLALHLVLFMPTQCEKCSYNDTCPGGIAWVKCRTALRG